MAAALIQPAFSSLAGQMKSEEHSSGSVLMSANTSDLDESNNLEKSDSDTSPFAGENDSDDEIHTSVKKAKRGRRATKVLSDDSSDESDNIDAPPNQNHEVSENDFLGNKKLDENVTSNAESTDGEKSFSAKRNKKKRKVMTVDDESEDESTDHNKNVKIKHRSRRKEKEKIENKSKRGSAMKKLLKSRAKKKLKTFQLSGDEGPNENSDDLPSGTDEEGTPESISLNNENVKSKKRKDKMSSKSKIKKDKGYNPKDVESDEAKNDKENKENENVEPEFSDSDSSEEEVSISTIKKSYTTRRKSAVVEMDYEDEEEKIQREKTDKILENKDLFDADTEESDAANDVAEGSESEECPGNQAKYKKKKIVKPKRITKSETLEIKSEQQKLVRNQRIKLPEHRPTVVSIANFLERVPILKLSKDTKKPARSETLKESQTILNKDQPSKSSATPLSGSSENLKTSECFRKESPSIKKLKNLVSVPFPKLSSKVVELEIEFEDENSTAAPGLTSLMQRLEKHTGVPKQKEMESRKELAVEDTETQPDSFVKKSIIDLEKIEKAADIPGSRLQELKNQLQKGMKALREVNRKEAEIRHKFENEEFEDEEEWEVEEEDNEADQADENENSEAGENIIASPGKKTNVDEDSEKSEGEDDDELKKWNEEDERKQIETQIEEQGEAEKDPQNTSNSKSNLTRFSNYYDETTTASARTGSSSLDLFPGVNEDADNNGDSAFNLELKSTFQWDDTSTIPPGQGDSVKDSNKSRLEASTPFSKLLNSSRRYSSASDDPQKMSSEDEIHHTKNISTETNDDSSLACPIISDDLHFALDENTQFSQILDTQGYFQPRKGTSAKNDTKKETNGVSSSMSQLLGLCSGDFASDKGKRISLVQDDFGLPSDLPLDAQEDDDNSQDFLDLCTGKFIAPGSKDKLKSPSKKTSILSKLLDQPDAPVSDSQAMLDLCSGAFASTAGQQRADEPIFEESKSTGSLMKHFGEVKVDSHARKSFNNLFSDKTSSDSPLKGGMSPKDEEDGVDEESIGEDLLCLCTGKFTDRNAQQNIISSEPENSSNSKLAEECEGSEIDDDNIAKRSKNEPTDLNVQRSDGNSVTEDENQDDPQGDEEESDLDEQADSDEEVNEELQEYFESLPKKKFTKKQFYEDEAELSGSDASDDEDLGSEADEYEVDSDIENLPSDKKIKAQVQKAHMKATLEKDKQDIRLFQERFFEDGDLFSDGVGRRRNFKWRNIDRPMNAGAESEGSGAEEEDENDDVTETEAQKRIQRLEKEAFLEEQRKSQETVVLDEDSQSILSIIKERKSLTDTVEAPKATFQTVKPVGFKRQGSFLDRNKTTLSRISTLTTNHTKKSAPSRSFVFQAKSSNNTPETSGSSKAMRRQLSDSEPPQPKKVKMDRTLSVPMSSSIFNHL